MSSGKDLKIQLTSAAFSSSSTFDPPFSVLPSHPPFYPHWHTLAATTQVCLSEAREGRSAAVSVAAAGRTEEEKGG